MTRFAYLTPLVCLLARPVAAEPGFAEPPGEPLVARDQAPPEFSEDVPLDETVASSVRVSVGPGLRISEHATDGGLAAAIDVGSGAIGARATGSWVRVGSDVGLSQYGGDLWIDFGSGRRLHPIVGAGAAVARLNHREPDGSVEASTYGVGILRGSLEYVLPVERADARAGIDAVGSVPAVQSRSAPDISPWLLVMARVGIGF
jgi:hypothetical protein